MPDQETNPMPAHKSTRQGAAAIKSLIGLFAVAEMVFFGFSSHYNKSKSEESGSNGSDNGAANNGTWTNDQKINLLDSLSIGMTIIDFGLSCGVGYGLYSPMDASPYTEKDKGYPKLIKNTSDACGNYTNLWFFKTIIAVALPIASVALSKEDIPKGQRAVDVVNSSMGGMSALISIVLEGIALGESCKVEDSKLTDSQKKDKQAFQTETSAFIIDDVRTVADAIITGFKLTATWVIVVREVIAIGYASAMFVEAGIIDNS